ncbi:hypothetical protein [Paracidovorax citrulli]
MKNYARTAAATILAFAAATAHGAFYVNEDAPNGVSPAAAAAALLAPAARESTLYVSFAGTWLSKAGKSTLQQSESKMHAADSIAINAFARTRGRLAAANKRAIAVKAWLVKQGIPEGKVTAYTELDPEADPQDTDVQVVARSRSLSAQLSHTANLAPAQPAPTPVAEPRLSGDTQATADDNRLLFTKRIIAMAQKKVISSDDAITLLNEFLKTPDAATAVLDTNAPNAPLVVHTTPPVDEAKVWLLKGKTTLRENMKEWATLAGYSAPEWSAAGTYDVQYDKPFTGTYLEVLAEVAKIVPTLDFRVSKNRRTVQIADVARTN